MVLRTTLDRELASDRGLGSFGLRDVRGVEAGEPWKAMKYVEPIMTAGLLVGCHDVHEPRAARVPHAAKVREPPTRGFTMADTAAE